MYTWPSLTVAPPPPPSPKMNGSSSTSSFLRYYSLLYHKSSVSVVYHIYFRYTGNLESQLAIIAYLFKFEKSLGRLSTKEYPGVRTERCSNTLAKSSTLSVLIVLY